MIELRADGALFVRAFLAATTRILVLFAGKAINRRVALFREYNIPEPVTGGLLFALAIWAIHAVSGYEVVFDLTVRDVLLVYFFTTIGINARLSDLRTGGRPLVVLLASVAAFMVIQNCAGMGAAWLVGRPPEMGLIAGSVSTRKLNGIRCCPAASSSASGSRAR